MKSLLSPESKFLIVPLSEKAGVFTPQRSLKSVLDGRSLETKSNKEYLCWLETLYFAKVAKIIKFVIVVVSV